MIHYRCVRVRTYHTSVTNETDHATDTNHSVIRHNHTSSPGTAGDDRQGRSIIWQHRIDTAVQISLKNTATYRSFYTF